MTPIFILPNAWRGHRQCAGRSRAPTPSTAAVSRLLPSPNEDVAALLDKVEAVEVEVYPRARVVVNERTGTVVIGGTVRLQPVSILHGGLSVNVISTTAGVAARPFLRRHHAGGAADHVCRRRTSR